MHALYRRLGGIALALVMVPVFIGLLACMPVPVGNPERSRINDELTGAWVAVSEGDTVLFLVEPYDKRTWLVHQFPLVAEYEQDAIELDIEAVLAGIEEIDDDNDDGRGVYKAWRTRIAGEQFFVWELRTGLEMPGFEKEAGERFWWVWRTERLDGNRLRLYAVSGDYEGFEEAIPSWNSAADRADEIETRGLKRMRRAVERVIRKNIDDPELYDDYYDDDEAFIMFRLTAEQFDELNL